MSPCPYALFTILNPDPCEDRNLQLLRCTPGAEDHKRSYLIDCRALSVATPSYKRSTQAVFAFNHRLVNSLEISRKGDRQSVSRWQIDLCQWNVHRTVK